MICGIRNLIPDTDNYRTKKQLLLEFPARNKKSLKINKGHSKKQKSQTEYLAGSIIRTGVSLEPNAIELLSAVIVKVRNIEV